MGTYYHQLKEPWSGIRVVDNGHHTRITLWQDGANAGTLAVRSENKSEAVRTFLGPAAFKRSARGGGMTEMMRLIQEPRGRVAVSEYHDEVVPMSDLVAEEHEGEK